MAKKNLSLPAGIRSWERACGFESQAKAALELGVPHRTYTRWLAQGIPSDRPSSLVYREFITAKMEEILADRKKSSAKS